jgi:hypothetical protein
MRRRARAGERGFDARHRVRRRGNRGEKRASICRLQPVFSNTPRTWVRIVLSYTPPSAAMVLTALPEARLRATRASAGVRSNRDCTNSTGGACGGVTGVRVNTA